VGESVLDVGTPVDSVGVLVVAFESSAKGNMRNEYFVATRSYEYFLFEVLAFFDFDSSNVELLQLFDFLE